MKPVKNIERTGSVRFRLDLHTDYLQRIYDVVHGIAPAKILLESEDIAKWDAGIKAQSDIAREVRASKTTEDLEKKDGERDKVISSLFQEIRNAARSPIATRREPGRTLKLIVDVYSGLQKERWAGKTVHTKGLLDDLAKTEAAAAVSALNLTELVALLRNVNEEFSALRESRTKESAEVILPNSRDIRAQNDAMTFDIFHHIEAAYTTTDNEADRKAIGELIDQINVRIRESKATHNKSLGQKKAAAARKMKNGSKKPKDPKTPKNPENPSDDDDELDIHLPEDPEEPKKPEGGDDAGDDDAPDIHLPED